MSNTPKKKIIDDITKVGADFLQPVFGGDSTAQPGSVEKDGHIHDGGNTWGHVQPIDLTKHTTNRLVLQDAYSVARSISAYPSQVVAANNYLSASFLNVASTALKSAGNLNAVLPFQQLDGYFNALTTSGIINATQPVSPFTTSNIVASALWYFGIPFDMDISKNAYFSFAWMGDILTTDGYGNIILDPGKISAGQPQSQTTTFRITWQWYSSGYAIFPPAVIYDGYTPANLNGANINQNSLTRGRIANLVVNQLPFRMIVNDSSTSTFNYVGLTGLQQATSAVMVGIQVDILSTGFVNTSTSSLSGHLSFFQGNLIYLSKTLRSASTSFGVL